MKVDQYSLSITDRLKIEDGENPQEVIFYGQPGEGAVEYARQFVGDMGKTPEARETLIKLLNEELPGIEDRRVKRCDYCRYLWRDDSLRNNRKSCCEDCRQARRKLQKRKEREREELINPKPRKRTKKDDYVYWIEYPYWSNEDSMLAEAERYEKPYGVETLDYLDTQNQIYGEGNGKRRTSENGYGF
ncbi:hypothetical protein J0K78_06345 [Halobacillus sp. GSS1]|uniref:hypothetical protein n=1 Tax=Halobacillus sp. GSS1 TaxID=2815919 RepID=UPI001A8D2B13|nr:hypothetical protein [Halobacillus sp. GSS1]MBN9653880.1 hypothetical protein [Halobacillus sp. GSS1]